MFIYIFIEREKRTLRCLGGAPSARAPPFPNLIVGREINVMDDNFGLTLNPLHMKDIRIDVYTYVYIYIYIYRVNPLELARASDRERASAS